MRLRTPALLAALAVAGAAVGWSLGTDGAQRQHAVDGVVRPLAAVSPSVPTPAAVTTLPDPATPALTVGLPMHTETLTGRTRFSVPIPDGWVRTPTAGGGEWSWAPPGLPVNAYALRIKLLGTTRQSVTVAQRARVFALTEAADDGNIQDLEVTADTGDAFIADYVDDGYRRFTLEKFVPFPGSTTTFAEVRLVGRQADVAGMTDLLARVSDGLLVNPPLPEKPKKPSSSPTAG